MKKYLIIFILFALILVNGIIQANPNFILVYVVQSGDTIIDIARDYGVSVASILEKNDISKEELIKVGQELIIPRNNNYEKQNERNWDTSLVDKEDKDNLDLEVDSNYAIRINPKQPLPDVNIPKSKIIKYHVGKGDTLFDIADLFNTSIGVIMALNNMDNNIIRVGQTLRIPINNLTPKEVLARTINSSEKKLLARAIHAEARGEPFQGQIAVGAVIINRVISSSFPDSIKGVIYQPGQFTAVDDGQINLTPNRKAFRAVEKAIAGYDPTMGSLYYYNPKTAEDQWWFATRKKILTIGDHVFAK